VLLRAVGDPGVVDDVADDELRTTMLEMGATA